MTDRPLPRKLEQLAAEYDQIRLQWETLGAEEAARRLDALIVQDDDGVNWRISRIDGTWQAAGYDGQWAEADPYEFADSGEVSVDDWSSPTGPGDWADPQPQNDLPLDDIYSDNQGVTEDWSAMIPGGPGNVIPGSGVGAGYGQEPDNLGWEEPAGWGQPGGGAGNWGAEPGGWEQPTPQKEGILAKIGGAFGGVGDIIGRLPRVAQIGAGVLIVALVAFLMLSGGRGCPTVKGLTLLDSSGEPIEELSVTDKALHCIIGVPLFYYPDEFTGELYFSHTDPVTVLDFTLHVGTYYRAVGGERLTTDLEGLNALGLDLPAERALVTGAATGVLEGNPLSTAVVTRNQVVTALGRLHYGIGGEKLPSLEEVPELGRGGTAEARTLLAALVADKIVEGEDVYGDPEAEAGDIADYDLDGPASLGEIARLMAAVYEAGGGVKVATYGEVGQVETGDTEDSGTSPVTFPTEELGDLPTGDQIAGAVAALNSGERQTLVAIINRPGNANQQALETARYQGYREAGVVVRAPAGATTNDEGAVVVGLEFVDADTDTVLGRQSAIMVKGDGYWQWRNWPVPKPVETE